MAIESSEIIGKHINTLVPNNLREQINYIIKKVDSGEILEQFETKLLTKDGRLIDVSLTVSPLSDDNKIIGASIITRDIGEQKKLRKLKSSQESRKNYSQLGRTS
jgi:PAS domain S-box-containing protein